MWLKVPHRYRRPGPNAKSPTPLAKDRVSPKWPGWRNSNSRLMAKSGGFHDGRDCASRKAADAKSGINQWRRRVPNVSPPAWCKGSGNWASSTCTQAIWISTPWPGACCRSCVKAARAMRKRDSAAVQLTRDKDFRHHTLEMGRQHPEEIVLRSRHPEKNATQGACVRKEKFVTDSRKALTYFAAGSFNLNV
jgi:hypothetical protein